MLLFFEGFHLKMFLFRLFFETLLLTVNGENYYKVYTLFYMRASKFCLRRAVL